MRLFWAIFQVENAEVRSGRTSVTRKLRRLERAQPRPSPGLAGFSLGRGLGGRLIWPSKTQPASRPPLRGGGFVTCQVEERVDAALLGDLSGGERVGTIWSDLGDPEVAPA